MACRIGMSKNPEKRIEYWKTKGYTHSKILAEGLTYDEAQEIEKKEAEERDCDYSPGGDPGENRYKKVWSVYHVWKSPS